MVGISILKSIPKEVLPKTRKNHGKSKQDHTPKASTSKAAQKPTQVEQQLSKPKDTPKNKPIYKPTYTPNSTPETRGNPKQHDRNTPRSIDRKEERKSNLVQVKLQERLISRIIGHKGSSINEINDKYKVNISIYRDMAFITGDRTKEAAEELSRIQEEKRIEMDQNDRIRESRRNVVCRYFMEDGKCPRENSCHFLHPQAEGGHSPR